MTLVNLTFAGREYDRTRALIDGTVEPQGIRLNFLLYENPDYIFRRMIAFKEFDACEFSLSSYINMRAHGDETIVAIPVFPSRLFRHSFVFCNKKAGIKEPTDLEHKKVGIPEWQQTAAVWIKGILQHEYGVDISKIKWKRLRSAERFSLKPLKGFSVEDVAAEGQSAEDLAGQLLERGDIDALVSARFPETLYTGTNVKRLFDDWVSVESAYYKKTGIFPIMHTVVLKQELYAENPWIAVSLHDAFTRAKDYAYRSLDYSTDKISSVWYRSAYELQRDTMGRDPYPYNLKDNRKVIETLMQYQTEQEIISKPLPVESLFVPNLRD